jgi:hypothetical protein
MAIGAIAGGVACLVLYAVMAVAGRAMAYIAVPLLGALLIAAGAAYFWVDSEFNRR